MICPACGKDVKNWQGSLLHAVQCGLLLDSPAEDEWRCACGFHCLYNESIYEHLASPHDWPKILTRIALENM